MRTAVELMQSHFDTLARDQARWQQLIADDLVWELPYAPSIGHPPKLEGREQITNFVTAFLKDAEGFSFHNLKINALANGTGAVAEVQATARIASTGRHYQQTYIVFLEASEDKISHLREYFNPVLAAFALGAPIVELTGGKRD